MKNLARIFSYARSSTDAQKISPQTQTDRAIELAAKLEAEGEGKLFATEAENESATEIPWNQRPKLKKIIEQLQKGDILICWQLNRIDRNPMRMIRFCEFCMNRGVRLFLLKEPFLGCNEVEFGTALGRAFIYMGAIFNDFWLENHKEAIREALKWRKKNGMAYTGLPKRWMRRVVRQTDKGEVKLDEYDPRACMVAAEMYTRWKYGGESSMSIARDMNRRQEKLASSGLICPTASKHLPKALQTPDYRRFNKIFKEIRVEIESHNGMMGDIQTPYYPDEAQMAIKPVNSNGGRYFILQG